MNTLFFRLLGSILFGVCWLILNLVYLALSTFMQLLPSFLSLVRNIIQAFLVLSYRLYHSILVGIQPYLTIDILRIPWRWILTILISTSLGSAAIVLLNLPWTLWVICFSMLHGLLVGIAWNKLEGPDGLNLGVKI